MPRQLMRLLAAMTAMSIGAALPLCQDAGAAPSSATATARKMSAQGPGAILLTIFLRHDQSKTLGEINAQLRKNGYYRKFPPKGVEVVSWYVMMGIGQVVTLRVPPERLREVNRAIEESAWGAYRTEFYPTYDYKAIAEAERQSAR